MNQNDLNLHGDSYRVFWEEEFPAMWKALLEKTLSEWKNHLSFQPKISDVKVIMEDDLSVKNPETYCRQRSIDYTQSLTVEARLSKYGAVQRVYLGHIPKMTKDGTFILNGKERLVIAQLIPSPGVYFYRENRIKKYRYKAQYYDIEKTVHIANFIPHDGVWLEFAIFRTEPEDQIEGLPVELQEKIRDDDGRIWVKVRRKKWFPVGQLYLALEMMSSHDIESLPPDETEDDEYLAVPTDEEERQYLLRRRNWTEIAQCLFIDPSGRSDEETKRRIQETLLDENNLSELGRYQIKRRLLRLQDPKQNTPATDLHLCKKDILGISEYLERLYKGERLPLDNRRSLANKRVRLLGDLLAEEVMPRIIRNLGNTIRKRIERAIAFRERIDDDKISEFIGRSALANDNFFKSIKEFFTSAELSRLVPQENQLAKKALFRRITLFGPGGLPSVYVKDVRDIHWTHYGRLCPVDTPQSERLGATLSVPLEARINKLGLLEAPYLCVEGGKVQSDAVKYLTAAQEEEQNPWIAYHDQKEALQRGNKAWARRGPKELELVESNAVGLIDAHPLQQFSLMARMIPFIQHDDANRVLMACSAMRQALPLKEREPPWINTGYGESLVEGEPPWSFGRNLLVAYMPYRGLNFEDAIVVSKSAAEKLTSVHCYEYTVGLKEYSAEETFESKKGEKRIKQKIVRQEVSRDIHCSDSRKKKLGDEGIVREGEWVEPGDILVGIVDPHQKKSISILQLAGRSIKGKSISPWDHSFTVPRGERGKVTEVDVYSVDNGGHLPGGVWKLIKIKVELEKPLEVGDKLSNRHGGKGVVSAILDDEEMPYFPDESSGHDHGFVGRHEHIEVIMNPLGVISRLNLGQLYETHLGWIGHRTGETPWKPVLPFEDSLQLLMEANKKISGNPLENGKAWLVDPRTGTKTARPVTIGYCYILRLHHLAGDKVHGRGYPRYSYNQVSQQPLQGKKRGGGQRMGEMEIWALEGYNARHIIQEMLTLKSDNLINREFLFQGQISSAGSKMPLPELPEFLRVLSLFLFGVGLKLNFMDNKDKKIEIFNQIWPISPEKVSKVSIQPPTSDEIRKISSGEITAPYIGTEKDGYTDMGLFSQTIFGPLVDWVCKCGTLHTSYRAGAAERCKKCNVEVGKSETRRYRLAHIPLPYKVFNVVFMNVASQLLGLSLERLKSFLIEKPRVQFAEPLDAILFLNLMMNASNEFKTRVEKRLELDEDAYSPTFSGLSELFSGSKPNYLNGLMTKEMLEGLSSIELLGEMLGYLTKGPLQEMRKLLLDELLSLMGRGVKQARQKQIRRRLGVIDGFLSSGIFPSHMMIGVLPVLPPDLRPPYVTEQGKVVWGEVNLLYQDVVRFIESHRDKKREDRDYRQNVKELQRRVSALIDNRRAWPPSYNSNGERYEQCLTHFLKGKKGFLRANLLGKRVDYSGRAVIVPDPDLSLDQCGLPYAMAVEIFRPILIPQLRDQLRSGSPKKSRPSLSDRALMGRINRTLRNAPPATQGDHQIDDDKKLITSLLNKIGSQNPILLNRQPTLHRLGVQAFYPKVNKHNAVSMHPLVTAGFNADFDGDTVAIHRIVTQEAKVEASVLLASNNLLSPANGSVTLNLGQDVALGMYLYTSEQENRNKFAEITAYRSEKALAKKELTDFLRKPLTIMTGEQAGQLVDQIKEISFEAASSSGITLSVFDMPDLCSQRDSLILKEDAIQQMSGFVAGELEKDPDSSISIILKSGARGDDRNITQLIGMRGMMERITGDAENSSSPIVWSSLREGMNLGEYFASCYGSRTSLVDKKLGTAEAGYVTRQFVEVTHRYRITEENCAGEGGRTAGGIEIEPYRYEWLDLKDWDMSSLIAKLHGKYVKGLLWLCYVGLTRELYFESVEKILDTNIERKMKQRDPTRWLLGVKIREKRGRDELVNKLFGRVLLSPIELEDHIIEHGFLVDDEDVAGQLADMILNEERSFMIRSPLTCESRAGVCQQCYGLDLTTRKLPDIGAKVGVISAQSIGEPGTQLVLRTFHHGGILGMATISKDIPKVQRFLNNKALAEIEASDLGLTEETYPLLLDAIKTIYQGNNADISDQHFEVLLKGLLSKVQIGDQDYEPFFPGQVVEKSEWVSVSERPDTHPILSSIGTIVRNPASWLSAASFGNTLEVLSRAAISASKDDLVGLKENIIMGKLLP